MIDDSTLQMEEVRMWNKCIIRTLLPEVTAEHRQIGKPISLRKRDLAQKVGLFYLIFLLVVVFYNDITRLFE